MAVIKWTLWDPVLGTTLTFPINPAEGFLPEREKTFTMEHTTAPNGKFIAFEGPETSIAFNFSGTFLEESSYDFMISWFNKKYQLRLTDDLGNEYWVYLKKFSPKRRRSSNYTWAFTYDAEAVVINWP
jgi:hypothetical protein